MTPRRLDPQSVRARLAEIDQLLGWLADLGSPTGAELRRSWRTRLLAERLLQQLVEMAVAICQHVAKAEGVAVAEDYRSAFGGAADAGLITSELADRLRPAAGLRNVVVHDYLGVDLDVVAAAIPRAQADFSEFRRQAARWLLAREEAERVDGDW